MRLRLLGVVVLLVYAACGDGSSPIVPNSVTIVSGDNQSAALGDPLALPLTVQVMGSDGRPYAGARVTWAVTTGSAAVTNPTDTTDANGESSTSITIGVSPGNLVITATVTGVTPASFQAEALDPCDLVLAHTVGTTTNGTLTAFDCQFNGPFYTDFLGIALPAQQAVMVEMTATFDTYLEQYHLSGPFIAINDDLDATNTNSRIRFIAAAGNYVMAASTFGPNVTGPYALTTTAQTDAINNCPVDPFLMWITRGVALTQQLEATDCPSARTGGGTAHNDRVLITLAPARPLSVTMASGAFNPRIELWLLSPTAPPSLVTSVDGVAGSATLNHTPAATNIYRVDFTSVDTVQTGAYTANVTGPSPANARSELPLGTMLRWRAEAERALPRAKQR